MAASQDRVSVAFTPKAVREAVLELMKYGAIEAARKPNIYRKLFSNRDQLDRILDPLGLAMSIDDRRGLAFLSVPTEAGEEVEAAAEEEDWLHPLVRRARLTLEQSLVVAILREQFIGREMDAGQGVEVNSSLDDILPRLRDFLGETGSDQLEDKRARTLMDQLSHHGVVSDINTDGRFVIRPLIVHLASPENLDQLLRVLKKAANGAPDESGEQHETTE